MMKIRAIVLGASGYVGGELLRLLSRHPALDLGAAVSDSLAGQPVASAFPHLGRTCNGLKFVARTEWDGELADGDNVAVFCAAPHGEAAATLAGIVATATQRGFNLHIVDSSADFRFEQQEQWESIYQQPHGAPHLLPSFSSVLPEHCESVSTPHIGHPGCFATASILAAVPLITAGVTTPEVFVTGITGSTGSGKSPQAGTHHPERNSNLYAYKALQHRHAPEVARLTSLASGRETSVNFVPHSGPFARGIHVTLQATATSTLTETDLLDIYRQAYDSQPFVTVAAGTPRLKSVVGSNDCHIGVASNGHTVAVFAVIDNLVKGAAGGAVQWMNRLWDLPQTLGLEQSASGWT